MIRLYTTGDGREIDRFAGPPASAHSGGFVFAPGRPKPGIRPD